MASLDFSPYIFAFQNVTSFELGQTYQMGKNQNLDYFEKTIQIWVTVIYFLLDKG